MRFSPMIFLDMDGVVANFLDPICAAHGVRADRMPPGVWDILPVLEMTPEKFYKPCDKQEFWEGLPLYPNAREFVKDLIALAPVTLCTHPTKDGAAWAGKYNWARRCFGPGLPIIMAEPNKAVLSRPGAILIDDNEAIVDDWEKRGGQAVLFPRRWNAGHSWLQAVAPMPHQVHELIAKQVQKCLVWHDLHAGSYLEDGAKPRDGWRSAK